MCPGQLPLQKYQSLLKQNKLQPDPHQHKLVTILDNFYCQLVQFNKLRPSKFVPAIFYNKNSRLSSQGFYIWGTVGRGKTYLTEIFLDCLKNIPNCSYKTWHLYNFMQMVHKQLKECKNKPDALDILAQKLAKKYKVIFIDELFIVDIADAMCMLNLLQSLFKHKLILIISSNFPPDDLYKDGLQRDQFMPAIALIKQTMQIIPLSDEKCNTDFRKLMKNATTSYYHLHCEETVELFTTKFRQLAKSTPIKIRQSITIFQRQVNTIMYTENLAWFDFNALCKSLRSNIDYLEIVKRFQVLFISDIQQMDDTTLSSVRRFIGLIDAIYYAKVKLILASHVDITNLYTGNLLAEEFSRTQSRLYEIKSEKYQQTY